MMLKSGKWAAWLLALAGMLMLRGARAESWPDRGMGDPYQGDPVIVTWQELNVFRDAAVPVFSAPFEDAWRGEEGKAAISAGGEIRYLGSVEGGAWNLVDYQAGGEDRRIGWIRMPENDARLAGYQELWLQRMPLRVTRAVTLTDDPLYGNREICALEPGEQVIGMFYYAEKESLYVETRYEGKTVWGLMPADAAEDMTDTFLAMDGDTVRIREGITVIGQTTSYENRYVTRIRPGDISIDELDLSMLNDRGIRRVELPRGLRRIARETIWGGELDELRFSGGVEVSMDALYDTSIGRIVLARDYTGIVPGGVYTTIREWEVEEGNPVYRDIDGVLFSADGKTLLQYPNNRPGEHYDVPAGTEEIADGAFYSKSLVKIPLRSISLPMGLKRIGEYAFGQCGFLLSLAVPLTVDEIAPSAFANCVSLERLSLPPGFTVEHNYGVRWEDFSTGFRGDNWATYTDPEEGYRAYEEYEGFPSYPVWLDNAEGCGTVPVYNSPAAETPSGEEPAGSREYVYGIQNGRADIGGECWVDLHNVRNASEDVFFRIIDGEPADPDLRASPNGDLLTFTGIGQSDVHFGSAGYWIDIPVRETLLYRERTGQGEKMGIVLPEGDSTALLDAAGGTKLGHLYFRTQARILEETEDWLRIETTYGMGWIPRNELMIVAEKAAAD